jgi:bleomycin hydrolase
LFTGVDILREDGQDIPRLWRVENSWGEKSGDKGYYLINDNWFDQYMFEVAAPRNYMPDNLLGALEEDPIVLPPGSDGSAGED